MQYGETAGEASEMKSFVLQNDVDTLVIGERERERASNQKTPA